MPAFHTCGNASHQPPPIAPPTQACAQVTETGNGTVEGQVFYDLLPFRGNDININFNVRGPAEAAAYHPNGVFINGDACSFLN